MCMFTCAAVENLAQTHAASQNLQSLTISVFEYKGETLVQGKSPHLLQPRQFCKAAGASPLESGQEAPPGHGAVQAKQR